MGRTFTGRLKLKRDTSANWTTNNPVLLNGELILVDTDSGELRTKTGDGVKTYTQLPFDDEVLRNLINSNAYTHPSYTGQVSGLYKITVDELGHISSAAAVTSSDIENLGFETSEDAHSYVDEVVSGFSSDIFNLGTTAPTNTKLLWIDSGNSYCLKFYNAGTGQWQNITAVWS